MIGSSFVDGPKADLNLIFSLQFERTVNRDNTVSFQKLTRHAGQPHGHRASAPGRDPELGEVIMRSPALTGVLRSALRAFGTWQRAVKLT